MTLPGPYPRLAIIGAGAIGCEFAYVYSRFGSKVTIIEMLDNIAKDVDPAANYFLMKRLLEEEVNIMTGTTVKSIADDRVTIEKGGKELTSVEVGGVGISLRG